MLIELLKNKEFCNKIEEFLKIPEILDVIIFGSAVKGKEHPEDIDILIVYSKKNEKQNETTYKIRKELQKTNPNIEILDKTYEELFSPSFLAREAFISEGFSMRKKEFVSKGLGYTNYVLFRYSLKGLNNSNRMQFYYSLYGRGKNLGMLEKNNTHKFSNEIIIAPIENSEIFKDFFKRWGIEYIDFPIIIPERIIKSKLIMG